MISTAVYLDPLSCYDSANPLCQVGLVVSTWRRDPVTRVRDPVTPYFHSDPLGLWSLAL